jgi:hypothetical protein
MGVKPAELDGREQVLPVERLSVLTEKQELYAAEVWSRESWESLESLVPGRGLVELDRLALLLIKPDGIVSHAVVPALAHLREEGFVPVAATAVEFDPNLVRSLWLYKFNAATVDRVRAHDAILAQGPSLLVALRDEVDSGLPAAVRLTELKGSSDPAKRGRSHLRTRLGVKSRILNLIHTADEPADVVRELGLLLGPAERTSLLEEALRGVDRGAAALARGAALAPAEPRLLDPAAVIERLTATSLLTLLRPPRRGSWAEVDRLLGELDPRLDAWDRVVLEAHLARLDSPGGQPQTIGDAAPAAWLRRTGPWGGRSPLPLP